MRHASASGKGSSVRSRLSRCLPFASGLRAPAAAEHVDFLLIVFSSLSASASLPLILSPLLLTCVCQLVVSSSVLCTLRMSRKMFIWKYSST